MVHCIFVRPASDGSSCSPAPKSKTFYATPYRTGLPMDTHLTDHPEEPLAETPEDVAILYSWANLHGAKYRDFSASRREYRAQLRHRAAQQVREQALLAQAEAEAAADAADSAERRAVEAARI